MNKVAIEHSFKKWVMTDISKFIVYNNVTYDKPKHLKPVIEILSEIMDGTVKHFAFSVPPQHYKSVTLLNFIAMYLTKYPTKIVVYASYAQRFAESQVEKATRIFKQFNPNAKIVKERSNEFLLYEGGGIITTSVQGVLTGFAVDLLIIDDPISDRAEAESSTFRNKTWDWWQDVAKTRLRPNKTSCIVLHTRWHKDDLIGRMKLNEEDFTFINIPAVSINDEPLLHSLEFYNKIKKSNSYGYYSLYQGEPIGREHQIFKDVYFYKELPNTLRYSIGTDLAYSSKTKSDYSVAVVMAESEGKFYIVDVLRWQSDINETITRLKNLQTIYNVTMTVESNGVQKAVADMLKKNGLKIREIYPVSDKMIRATEFSSNWNDGNVFVPENANWLNTYLDELYSFSGNNDIHDDQIDASVYAFNQINKSKGVVLKW